MTTAQITFTSNGGMQFVKNYQKNDQGGVDSCSDTLVIPISPDSENYHGPIYDFKYYFAKRPKNFSCSSFYLQVNKNIKSEKTCRSLMKTICIAADIDLKDQNIVNHSGRSIPITFLFQKGVSTVTTMLLTGHNSESSYRIYACPSQQQKEEALSLLINNVRTLPLKDSKTSNNLDTSSNLNTLSNSDLNNTKI
ncbi:18786_t:CDS:2 [Racocetra fulgida]|uniref:18786_t:CDS:1 n=1 Tax=Racocetra fulgida TaxID=60492 RepID=A0A9N9CSB2_9GLOM|nr:18786_t:CDS:2 [Racocetra fulgida]